MKDFELTESCLQSSTPVYMEMGVTDAAYSYRGVCALARAERANAMVGHLGAAVIAGSFFLEQHPELDGSVQTAIAGELDRIIGGEESLWFDPTKSAITIPKLFEPFPKTRSQSDGIAVLAEALAANIDETRQSGHNVIFTALAIRALASHPAYATPEIVAGIRALIAKFDGTIPGRGYYGAKAGWITGDRVPLPVGDDLPPYASEQSLVTAVMDELVSSAAMRRQGFGGLHHIINHAAALVDLSRYGYGELARRGFAAHRRHILLWRSLPDVEDELGVLPPAAHDPRRPAYWRHSGASTPWSARLTHRVKTLYGFFTLAPLVEDPARRDQAETQFRYLMG